MGLLSITGWVIVVLAFLSAVAGSAVAVISGNYLLILVSFAGMAGGIYIGYLGIKVEQLEERPAFYKTISDLDERLKRIENPPESAHS